MTEALHRAAAAARAIEREDGKNPYFARIEAAAAAIGDEDMTAVLEHGYLSTSARETCGDMATEVGEAIKTASRRSAERAEKARIEAGGIRQHPAVRAIGPARLNENIRFRGGKMGVVLHRRDVSIVGYPIPLDDGRYLVAVKFGSHRYHEDAPPMFLALGRIVRSEKAARKALAAHEPTRRAERDRLIASRMEPIPDYGRPDDGETGERIYDDLSAGGYGSTYYASSDGHHVVVCTTEYDWPERYGRIMMTPAAFQLAIA